MKYLLENWSLFEDLSKGRRVCLFLDYDGTLSPIAPKPSEAFLNDNTRRRLEMLSLNHRCSIIVISGREITELMNFVNIPDIWYSGNHGLEMVTDKIHIRQPLSDDYFLTLEEVKINLSAHLPNFNGVIIEDKNLSLSIHYRLLGEDDLDSFLSYMKKLKTKYAANDSICFKEGKKVIEVRPSINWNKGTAVLKLLEELDSENVPLLPVYFGDDKTDEDAFEVLKNKGITVHVGTSNESVAEYFVNDTTEVSEFLFLLNQHLYKPSSN